MFIGPLRFLFRCVKSPLSWNIYSNVSMHLHNSTKLLKLLVADLKPWMSSCLLHSLVSANSKIYTFIFREAMVNPKQREVLEVSNNIVYAENKCSILRSCKY